MHSKEDRGQLTSKGISIMNKDGHDIVLFHKGD